MFLRAADGDGIHHADTSRSEGCLGVTESALNRETKGHQNIALRIGKIAGKTSQNENQMIGEFTPGASAVRAEGLLGGPCRRRG